MIIANDYQTLLSYGNSRRKGCRTEKNDSYQNDLRKAFERIFYWTGEENKGEASIIKQKEQHSVQGKFTLPTTLGQTAKSNHLPTN